MEERISIIVPIFNEEKTIIGVLRSLLKSNLTEEVICVNDGSTDKSLEILKGFEDKIVLVSFKRNRGKGFALAQGIKKAKGEIVIFLDADLQNLSPVHIRTLLHPILTGQARAVIGYTANKYDSLNLASDLSGQRAYHRKDLIPYLEHMKRTRYGVEAFLNGIFGKNETKKVPLLGVKNFFQYEKRSLPEALMVYVKMGTEIAKEMGRREVLSLKDQNLIENFGQAINIQDLGNKIEEIRNKRVRLLLRKYILGYLRSAQSRWRKA